MTLKSVNCLTGSHVPNSHGVIVSARRNATTVWAVRHAGYRVAVPRKRKEFLASRGIPDFYSIISATGRFSTVWTEDEPVRCWKRAKFPAADCIPDLHGLVAI